MSTAAAFVPPTRMERAVALPYAWFFNALVQVVPVEWLRGSRRLALWAYCRAYYYNERIAGRL